MMVIELGKTEEIDNVMLKLENLCENLLFLTIRVCKSHELKKNI